MRHTFCLSVSHTLPLHMHMHTPTQTGTHTDTQKNLIKIEFNLKKLIKLKREASALQCLSEQSCRTNLPMSTKGPQIQEQKEKNLQFR